MRYVVVDLVPMREIFATDDYSEAERHVISIMEEDWDGFMCFLGLYDCYSDGFRLLRRVFFNDCARDSLFS